MTPPFDQPPPPGTDTSGEQPYSSGVLARITAIHFPTRIVVAQQQWLLGIFGERNTPIKAISADGQSYDGISSGASIAGHTILSSGCVAAGQLLNERGAPIVGGDSFIAGDSNTGSVKFGTVRSSGVDWRDVWSAPGPILAVSYANGGFFVSYETADASKSLLAVTFDGESLISGMDPFSGIPDAGYGGAVAYINGTYATVGSVRKSDPGPATSLGGDYFMWASSLDGTNWSSGSSDLGISPLGNPSIQQTTICVGNGIFAAAGSECTTWTAGPPGIPRPEYVLPKCAIAESTNGQRWSVQDLPDAVARGSYELGDRGGATSAVAFISTGKGGYFVAAGNESGGSSGPGSFEPDAHKLWAGGRLILEETTAAFGSYSYGALSAIDLIPRSIDFI
jgi:hypothetical protein